MYKVTGSQASCRIIANPYLKNIKKNGCFYAILKVLVLIYSNGIDIYFEGPLSHIFEIHSHGKSKN
jgi:hypothetical protein